MSQKNNSDNLKRNILKELSKSYSSINNSYKYFKKLSKNKYKIIESANWILDNLYLIEREYKNIKQSMGNEYFKALPTLSRNNKKKEVYDVPRIFNIAQNYINSSGEFNIKDVSDYMSVFGVRAKSSPRDFSGRGYLNNGALHEFQTSNIVKDEDMLNDFLTEFIKKQKEVKIETLPLPLP